MSHEEMLKTDFNVGKSFYTATGEWIVRDIGFTCVIAVRAEDDALSHDKQDVIFYNYEFGGCSLVPFTEEEIRTSSLIEKEESPDWNRIIYYMDTYEEEINELIKNGEGSEFKDMDHFLMGTVIDLLYKDPTAFYAKSNKVQI